MSKSTSNPDFDPSMSPTQWDNTGGVSDVQSAQDPTATENNRYNQPPPGAYRPVSIAYEDLGLLPRSFNRVFDRFFKQLFDDVENLVLEEYRFYRYLFLTTLKTLALLLFAPLLVNMVAKHYVIRPLVESYWNTHQTEIFLNRYEQKKAFHELHDFEETLYFDALTLNEEDFDLGQNAGFGNTPGKLEKPGKERPTGPVASNELAANLTGLNDESMDAVVQPRSALAVIQGFLTGPKTDPLLVGPISESVPRALQKKVLELAQRYNERSIQAITNFLSDLASLLMILYLLNAQRAQIDITKSFLFEVFFGLEDTKKSLVMLIVTDFLVGYHSPTIWESFFQLVFAHYGLPNSQTAIFLLVATVPVLVDVVFKYLIFRHLNRMSPSTVAVYHAMIE